MLLEWKDTSGPAFPAEQWVNSDDPKIVNPIRHTGMTLRDYIAIHATERDLVGYIFKTGSTTWARYAFADDMLEARKESND